MKFYENFGSKLTTSIVLIKKKIDSQYFRLRSPLEQKKQKMRCFAGLQIYHADNLAAFNVVIVPSGDQVMFRFYVL